MESPSLLHMWKQSLAARPLYSVAAHRLFIGPHDNLRNHIEEIVAGLDAELFETTRSLWPKIQSSEEIRKILESLREKK